MLSGTLGNKPITAAKMDGADIMFTAGGTNYSGSVSGNTMKGSNWSATRK
jgi:hypothetical protein